MASAAAFAWAVLVPRLCPPSPRLLALHQGARSLESDSPEVKLRLAHFPLVPPWVSYSISLSLGASSVNTQNICMASSPFCITVGFKMYE